MGEKEGEVEKAPWRERRQGRRGAATAICSKAGQPQQLIVLLIYRSMRREEFVGVGTAENVP